MAERNLAINALRTVEPVTPGPPMPAPAPVNLDLFRGVLVSLEARLGEAVLTVDDIMALKPGSVVSLQSRLPDNIDLYLNNVCVARGEIVAVGQNFGVRIVEMAQPA